MHLFDLGDDILGTIIKSLLSDIKLQLQMRQIAAFEDCIGDIKLAARLCKKFAMVVKKAAPQDVVKDAISQCIRNSIALCPRGMSGSCMSRYADVNHYMVGNCALEEHGHTHYTIIACSKIEMFSVSPYMLYKFTPFVDMSTKSDLSMNEEETIYIAVTYFHADKMVVIGNFSARYVIGNNKTMLNVDPTFRAVRISEGCCVVDQFGDSHRISQTIYDDYIRSCMRRMIY